jgi:prepilin-type N-terminal cleavage/methylation domain-containing protein
MIIRRPQNAPAGFTIVEVMIVLAIAGVFLLLTFLAIPGLERSNRNGERKQSVALILAAASHYELSNSGETPPDCGQDSTLPRCTTTGQFADGGNLGYYDDQQGTAITFCNGRIDNGNNVTFPMASSVCNAPNNGYISPNLTSTEMVVLYNYARCDNARSQATIQGADSRNIVAFFELESSDPNMPLFQCAQLNP